MLASVVSFYFQSFETCVRVCVVPALAVNGPGLLPQPPNEDEQPPGFLDSILWMAVPKKRRTIEVNRTRRRAKEKLLKVQVEFLSFCNLRSITVLKTNFKMHINKNILNHNDHDCQLYETLIMDQILLEPMGSFRLHTAHF